jgi:hypothetical protein
MLKLVEKDQYQGKPKAKAKAKTMAKEPEEKDMLVDAGGAKRSGEEASPNKEGKKKAKKENAPAPLSVADVEVVKADAKPEQQAGGRKEHGPEKDNSTSRSHWMSKDRGYLFNQASQHGIRLDKSLLTGKKKFLML